MLSSWTKRSFVRDPYIRFRLHCTLKVPKVGPVGKDVHTSRVISIFIINLLILVSVLPTLGFFFVSCLLLQYVSLSLLLVLSRTLFLCDTHKRWHSKFQGLPHTQATSCNLVRRLERKGQKKVILRVREEYKAKK